MNKTPFALAFALVSTFAAPLAARAAETQTTDPYLESRVRQLEYTVRTLEFTVRSLESNQRQLEYRIQRLESQPRPPATAVCTVRTGMRSYVGGGLDVGSATAAARGECLKQETSAECNAGQIACG